MNDEEANEYDDNAYAEAVQELISGIDGMLDSGATVADVRAEFDALMSGRS